jgi:hypothetical protein
MSADRQTSNETADHGQAEAISAAAIPINNIGFCHTCNRQVEIDMDSFTCKNCNNGFIELFELNDENSNQGNEENDDETSQQSGFGAGGPRVLRFDSNENGMGV